MDKNELVPLPWITPEPAIRVNALLDASWTCFNTVNTVKKLLGDVGTHLVVILGSMTSQLQPLDVCINKPFNDRLKRVYED